MNTTNVSKNVTKKIINIFTNKDYTEFVKKTTGKIIEVIDSMETPKYKYLIVMVIDADEVFKYKLRITSFGDIVMSDLYIQKPEIIFNSVEQFIKNWNEQFGFNTEIDLSITKTSASESIIMRTKTGAPETTLTVNSSTLIVKAPRKINPDNCTVVELQTQDNLSMSVLGSNRTVAKSKCIGYKLYILPNHEIYLDIFNCINDHFIRFDLENLTYVNIDLKYSVSRYLIRLKEDALYITSFTGGATETIEVGI